VPCAVAVAIFVLLVVFPVFKAVYTFSLAFLAESEAASYQVLDVLSDATPSSWARFTWLVSAFGGGHAAVPSGGACGHIFGSEKACQAPESGQGGPEVRDARAISWSQIVEEAIRRGVLEVGGDELPTMRQANPKMQLIDIREESEVALEPIPEEWRPITIPRGVLERNIGEQVTDLDTEIVLVCRAGMRSVMAAETLTKMKYSRVYSLKEGAQVLSRVHPIHRAGSDMLSGGRGEGGKRSESELGADPDRRDSPAQRWLGLRKMARLGCGVAAALLLDAVLFC